jgi:hypothetical protein
VPELAEGFDPMDPANVSPLVCWLASVNSGEVTGQIFSVVGGYIGVVEGYNRGPDMFYDRKLTFAEIDSELPAVIQRAKPRTLVHASHGYSKLG